MQTAVPLGVGAMAALLPVSASDAEEICRLAAHQTQRVCQVANYNSSKQVTRPAKIASQDTTPGILLNSHVACALVRNRS